MLGLLSVMWRYDIDMIQCETFVHCWNIAVLCFWKEMGLWPSYVGTTWTSLLLRCDCGAAVFEYSSFHSTVQQVVTHQVQSLLLGTRAQCWTWMFFKTYSKTAGTFFFHIRWVGMRNFGGFWHILPKSRRKWYLRPSLTEPFNYSYYPGQIICYIVVLLLTAFIVLYRPANQRLCWHLPSWQSSCWASYWSHAGCAGKMSPRLREHSREMHFTASSQTRPFMAAVAFIWLVRLGRKITWNKVRWSVPYWETYNPGQKYMVHLENLLCFHYRPLFDDKSGSFPRTWPSPLPPYNVASRGALWAHRPNIVWGEGGRNSEIVKKGQVYHYFWPGLYIQETHQACLSEPNCFCDCFWP